MDDIVAKEAQFLIDDWLKRTEVCLNIKDNSVSTAFVIKEWKQLPKTTKRIPKVVEKLQNDSLQEKVNNNFIIESVDQLVDKNKVAKKVVAALLKAEACDPNASMEERHRLIRERKMIREMEHKKRDEEMKKREEIRAEALKLLDQEEKTKMLMKSDRSKFKTKKNNLNQLILKDEKIKQNEEDNEHYLMDRRIRRQDMIFKLETEALRVKGTYFHYWKKMVEETKILVGNADHVYQQKLQWKYLMLWKRHTLIDQTQVFQLADQYRRSTLLSQSFSKWKNCTQITKTKVKRKNVNQANNKYKSKNKKCLKDKNTRCTKSKISEISADILNHRNVFKKSSKVITTSGTNSTSKIHHLNGEVNMDKKKELNNSYCKQQALEKILESQRCQIKAQQKLIQELKHLQTVDQNKMLETNELDANDDGYQISDQNDALGEPIGEKEISENFLENKANDLTCIGVNHEKQSKSLCNIVFNDENDRAIPTLKQKVLKSKSMKLSQPATSDIDYKKPIEEIIKEELKSILTPVSPHQKSVTDSRYSKFLKDMERRNMEREKMKKEREEKKKKMEDDKFVKLQQEVAEKRKVEDEMKKKILLEIRERKMAEKERELVKKEAEERLKEQIKKADNARRFLLIKYWGWTPWVQLLQRNRAAERDSKVYHENNLMRKTFTAWSTRVKEELETKKCVAEAFRTTKLMRKYLHVWTESHEERVQNWNKACQHHHDILISKLFKCWSYETKRTKSIINSKMAEACNHHNDRLLYKCTNAWKGFVIIMEKERTREARLKHLRNKISQVIPDFSPNT